MSNAASPPVISDSALEVPAASAIRMKSVARVYPGPPQVTALGPVDVLIGEGEYVAIVGPSGSGKSTLLNLLGLLDRPTSGTYELAGVETTSLSEQDRASVRGRRIGFVFQDFQLLPHRTAIENVALGQLYVGQERTSRLAAADTMLCRVGLEHRRHALPTTLSGGERQRVAIARALVNSPTILLCDEPTGNLDSQNASQVMELLNQLHTEGVTIVGITHDHDIAAYAQRNLMIRDGRITDAAAR